MGTFRYYSGFKVYILIFIVLLLNIQALEYLLVHCGANPNSTDATNGSSLLHWASQRGNSTVVELLIQNEAEVDKMVRKIA